MGSSCLIPPPAGQDLTETTRRGLRT